jgi:ankyrin repeat protein
LIAAESGCHDLVLELLDPSQSDMVVGGCENALVVAIEKGHADIVDELLKRYIHPRALHIAAAYCRAELILTLQQALKQELSVSQEDSSECTPFHSASESGNVSVVVSIMEATKKTSGELSLGELVNAVDGEGKTALHKASRFGHVDVI